MINEDGDVWMFPYIVDPYYTVYNDDVCKNAGINISEHTDFYEFLDEFTNAQENNNKLQHSIGHYYYIIDYYLAQYLNTYDNFDTDEFKTLAKTLKSKVYKKDYFEFSHNMHDIGITHDYSKATFENSSRSDDHWMYIDAGYDITAMPYLNQNSKVITNCRFICVNPYSDNLEGTLSYITQLIKYSLNKEDNLSLKDNSIYKQSDYYSHLKNVYENSEIRFTISDEIYLDDFYDYLEGEIDLDSFIKEANRKIEAYRDK